MRSRLAPSQREMPMAEQGWSAASSFDRLADCVSRLAICGPALDGDGAVPPEIIALLHQAGLLAAPLRAADGGADLGSIATPPLLEALTAIGSGDLSIGRLYEGHVNALLLIDRFATRAQRRRIAGAVVEGALLGVWNTDLPTPLAFSEDGLQLVGGKSFASGAGLVSFAIVTARAPDGARQMLLAQVQDIARIDRSAWQPLGMRASMSFSVDFSGMPIDSDAVLGGSEDYLSEPHFSAGCIRFAAVQLGGALAILRIVHAHLRRTNRETDPYQLQRVARMRVALEGGRLWLRRAGEIFDQAAFIDADQVIAMANMARHAVEEACHLTLDLAARSIGVQGMLAPHPLERLMRDLTTYLRQPVPDAALASIGAQALKAEQLPW